MSLSRVFVFLLCLPGLLLANERPPAAAIASAHPLASQAGMAILAQGGNAFDAAIAVSAVLAVVEPYGSGMGGGGFWLLHRASDGKDIMIDGRETAPLAAHRDMYLDAQGEVIPGLSMNGPLAAGIPGQAAALVHLAEHYARLPLRTSLAPAIQHAREGVAVGESYRRMAGFRLEALRAWPETAAIFLHNGEVPAAGHRLVQTDLAETLSRLAENGLDGFYRGDTAKAVLTAMERHGGIWSQADFDSYRIIEREPIRSHYQGHEIISAAPPSSGGVALATILHILAQFPLDELDEVARTHLLAEAMRRAYRDRAQYLGDTDFVEVPLERLSHPHYGAGLAAAIRLDRATPSSDLPGVAAAPGGTHTSHFSVLDSEGNYVAATLSINYPFGSGFVVPGTGLLLNNEMDDFSSRPGSPNAYGLVGAEANAIAPGKRMLSSMSPSFVRNPDSLVVLGTPGGSRIISMVLQGILAHIDGAPLEAWIGRPRVHHQYLPDKLYLEPDALDEETRLALIALGHQLEPLGSPWGNMQALLWDKRTAQVSAASDPRGGGQALVIPNK
ncbi:MAG: gamma-glutamyltransferase [Thiohalomonadaceae bacterium]